jgi:hypothetical protein
MTEVGTKKIKSKTICFKVHLLFRVFRITNEVAIGILPLVAYHLSVITSRY